MALINLQTQKPSLKKSLVSSSVFRPSAPIASVAKIPFGGVAKAIGSQPKPLQVGNIDAPSEPSALYGIVDALKADVQSLRQEQSETAEILNDIGNALAADFAHRITEEKSHNTLLNRQRIKLRRKEKEDKLETTRSSNILGTNKKGGLNLKGAGGGIFGKLIKFFTTIGAGIALTTAFEWLKDESNRESLKKFFKGMQDNWKWVVGALAGLIALDITVKLVALAGAIKGLVLLLANPFVWAGVGVLIAAARQGLSHREKDVLRDLEVMGGPSQINRLKLIEIYKKRRLQSPDKLGYYNHNIRFLESGKYGYGADQKVIDWSLLEKGEQIDQKAIGGQGSGWTIVGERGPELINLPLNSHVVPNHAINRNLALNHGKTTIINMPAEVIEGKLPEIKTPSPTATSVPFISPINSLNTYMIETPHSLGISV